MKKIMICSILILILCPVTSFTGQKRVYTESDLERYQTSSSDNKYQKRDVVGQQKQSAGYRNHQGISEESERNKQTMNEGERRRAADRLRNR